MIISYRMTNIEIAKLLRKVAAAYTVLNESRFRILAYENAATSIEHSTSEVKDLWDDRKLEAIPGLGPSIISHLEELFTKGRVAYWEQVFKKVPQAIFPLLDIPGIGPKTANKLVVHLKLKDEKKAIEDLKKSAIEHKISSIDGFGDRSEKEIVESVERYEKGQVKENRLKINQADEIAFNLLNYLKTGEVLGSLRRRVATIGDIDLAVPTDNPEEIIAKFIKFTNTTEVIEAGPTGASIRLSNGRQVDLRVLEPKRWGSMLQYFTGSKYHNIKLREFALKKGLSLSEYGIKNLKTSKVAEFNNEPDFYKYLGLDYIPPELREDCGEIEMALKHKLPKLIALQDVKGDLQMHSSFGVNTSHDSGVSSMEELREKAKSLGYEYIGVSDHNPSTKNHTKDQIVEELKNRQTKIKKLNQSNNNVRVINLLEIDIQPNGNLPIPDEAMGYLDAFLVSIHSEFRMSREEMTNRVLKGFSHPKAKIFAHPTGRILGSREGYELDWDKIFSFCLQNDKALEINAYPDRLDLPDTLVREAVKRGVKLSLGTDSHIASDLDMMKCGVDVARRGWCKESDIVNCLNYHELIQWLKK